MIIDEVHERSEERSVQGQGQHHLRSSHESEMLVISRSDNVKGQFEIERSICF